MFCDDCGGGGKVSVVLRTVAGEAKVKSFPPHPNPLPKGGEGEREQICMVFRT
jgi:hypothetical protein